MKIQYIPLFVVFLLACTVSTPAPASTPAPEIAAAVIAENLPLPTPTEPLVLSRIPFATGKVYVRSCASTSCAELGWYEEGGRVVLTGAEVLDAASTECKQWYGVDYRGQAGWVCAAWVAR